MKFIRISVVPQFDQPCRVNVLPAMNYAALSAAAVVVLLAVIAVECGAYSPTSTKFDWSPNRNSQPAETARKRGGGGGGGGRRRFGGSSSSAGGQGYYGSGGGVDDDDDEDRGRYLDSGRRRGGGGGGDSRNRVMNEANHIQAEKETNTGHLKEFPK